MTQGDARFVIGLAEFALSQAETQAMLIKLMAVEMSVRGQAQQVRRRIEAEPDSPELQELRSQLDEAEAQAADTMAKMGEQLRSHLARSESNHEKMEAMLAQLRTSLGGDTDATGGKL